MENTGINSKVISEIRHFAEIYHVEKVLLFGSRARGDYKRTSDIVNLDSPMQDELRESIEKEGRILYAKNKSWPNIRY